jgi:hypothetical protein
MSTETTKPRRKRGPDKTGRVYLEVRYDKAADTWFYKKRGEKKREVTEPFQTWVITAANTAAREIEQAGGKAEVVLYTKRGNINKGHGGRQTYGDDPRRRKG